MSYQQFLAEMQPSERRVYLETNADLILEDEVYTRRLTEEELAQLEHELGNNSVELQKYERQKKDYLERLALTTKPLQHRNKVVVDSLRTKAEEVTGTVYEFKDIEAGTVEQYDNEGQFLGSRRMRPDENDGKVNIMRMGNRRTGTND